MPFQPCTGIAQVEVFFTQDSQRCENVFHAMRGAPWTSTQVSDLVVAVLDWVQHHWTFVGVADAAAVGVKAMDLSTEVGAVSEAVLGEPFIGGRPGLPLPMNATVAVSWHTALRGRSYRGRTYHLGLSADDVESSKMTVAALGLFQTHYAALITRIGDTGADMCVLSRYHDHAPRPVGMGAEIVSCSINNSLDSQRRRLPDRGA